MTDYREQAIRDVAACTQKTLSDIRSRLAMRRSDVYEYRILRYAIAQRERVLELEAKLEDAENKLRTHDGLVALKNGIPETTGDPVFDQVLRIYPVAEMLQRGWLGSATGFSDLPFLKKSLLRFFEAAELGDLLDQDFWEKKSGIRPARLQQKEGERA